MRGVCTVLLCCLLSLDGVLSVPLNMLATEKLMEITAHHELPAPYHKTDDILKHVQNLASTCSNGHFKLEMRTPQQAMDLEMDPTPIKRGKSDEYFDYQLQHQALLQSNVELEHNHASPRKEAGFPQSWLDKSVPPSELPVVHVSTGGGGQKKPAFIMFGEHGRELISCEIGMEFLKTVHDVACSPDVHEQTMIQIEESEYGTSSPYSRDQIRALLADWDLHIMPVVSPSAREIAEKADFCNRKNANRVDVNRNYPFHFGEGHHEISSEQFPGTKPLTEPETRVAAQLAREVHPRLFISVHSGAEMIVTSPAYRKFDLEQMPAGIQKVVKGVQQADCPSCTAGPASQVLSYLAYGCSMDYMFEQGFTDEAEPSKPSQEHFSFTFETWAGDKQKGMAESDLASVYGAEAGKIGEQEGNFKALKAQVGNGQYECLTRFNPPPSMYPQMLTKWNKALFSTMDAVNKELKSRDKVAVASSGQALAAVTPATGGQRGDGTAADPAVGSGVAKPAVENVPSPSVVQQAAPVNTPPTSLVSTATATSAPMVSEHHIPVVTIPGAMHLVQTEAGMERGVRGAHGGEKALDSSNSGSGAESPALNAPMDQLMNAEQASGGVHGVQLD